MARAVEVVVVALVATLAAGCVAAQAQSESKASPFPEERLHALVGKSARLCGTVVEYSCRAERDSELHLWSRPPDSGITVRVPRSSRPRFGLAFEGRTVRREVCAAGPISREEKRFVVQIDDPASFSFTSGEEPRGTPPDLVSFCDQNVVMPKLLKEVKAQYTRRALDARIEGVVMLDAIVGVDGKVGSIRILRSLGSKHGLDEQAIEALEQWIFTPGQHEGRPAPTRVAVDLSFTLRRQ
jgi:TonB family protein